MLFAFSVGACLAVQAYRRLYRRRFPVHSSGYDMFVYRQADEVNLKQDLNLTVHCFVVATLKISFADSSVSFRVLTSVFIIA